MQASLSRSQAELLAQRLTAVICNAGGALRAAAAAGGERRGGDHDGRKVRYPDTPRSPAHGRLSALWPLHVLIYVLLVRRVRKRRNSVIGTAYKPAKHNVGPNIPAHVLALELAP